MSAEQNQAIKKYLWFSKDPAQPEDEVFFVSDIERLFYLTEVKFEHTSRIRLLELEVIKLHDEGMNKSTTILDIESKLKEAIAMIESLESEVLNAN